MNFTRGKTCKDEKCALFDFVLCDYVEKDEDNEKILHRGN